MVDFKEKFLQGTYMHKISNYHKTGITELYYEMGVIRALAYLATC